MRSVMLLPCLLLVTVLQLSVAAQNSANDAKLLTELTKLERDSWEATMKDDKEFFRTYCAPEAKFFFADGSAASRDDLLRNLDDFHLTKYSMSEVSMLRVNEDSAMIIYRVSYEGVHKTKKEQFTDVESSSLYVRRDGKWLEIFYQETAKPRPDHGTAEEAQTLVAKAIALINKEGAAAFPKINTGENGMKDRDLYLFVQNTGPQAKVVAYGGSKVKKDPIGMPAIEVVGFAGKPIGKLIQEQATEKGAWIDYLWPNPITGKPEQKFTWFVRSGDYIVGCGIYGSAH